jgi:hypothetical protein
MGAGVLEFVHAFNGHLGGGDFLVIEDYADLSALNALCATNPDIGSLWEAVRGTDMSGRLGGLREFWRQEGEEHRSRLHERVAASDDDITELDQLALALEIVDELWHREPPGPDGKHDSLTLLFAVGTPGLQMEFEAEDPALVFSSGSIIMSLVGAGMPLIAASAWLLALGLGRGASAQAIGTNLAHDLRVQRLAEIRPADYPIVALPRLDDPHATAAHRDMPGIVFIHGLLSTDVGTFDGFIKEFHARAPAKAGEVRIFGWPHDTLASIDTNAWNLANLIHTQLGSTQPIVFVCHSRGGLVARATALKLYHMDVAYRAALRGTITFGTPHEGASLADVSSGDFLAYFIAVNAAARADTVALLSNILVYRKQQQSDVIQGVEDLRRNSPDGFIAYLNQNELVDSEKRPGRVRHMQLIAVGGDYRPKRGRAASLAKRFFGPLIHNDLVVEVDSSMPMSADVRSTMNCSHSGYFDDASRGTQAMTDAIDALIRFLP